MVTTILVLITVGILQDANAQGWNLSLLPDLKRLMGDLAHTLDVQCQALKSQGPRDDYRLQFLHQSLVDVQKQVDGVNTKLTTLERNLEESLLSIYEYIEELNIRITTQQQKNGKHGSPVVKPPIIHQLPSERGYTCTDQGPCAKFNKTPLTWDEANKACQEEGATLAINNEDAYNNFLTRMIQYNEEGWTWIGLRQTGPKQNTWVDGSLLGSFKPFYGPEAEDVDGFDDQECFALSGDFRLDDRQCNEQNPFICEIRPLKDMVDIRKGNS